MRSASPRCRRLTRVSCCADDSQRRPCRRARGRTLARRHGVHAVRHARRLHLPRLYGGRGPPPQQRVQPGAAPAAARPTLDSLSLDMQPNARCPPMLCCRLTRGDRTLRRRRASPLHFCGPQEARNFATNTNNWLADVTAQAKGAAITLNDHCAGEVCTAAMSKALVAIRALQDNTQAISDAFAYEGTELCPSSGCLNVGSLWFVDQGGCMCNAPAIAAVRASASEGTQQLAPCLTARRPGNICSPCWSLRLAALGTAALRA